MLSVPEKSSFRLVPVDKSNIEHLRFLNTAILPVQFTPKFYKEVGFLIFGFWKIGNKFGLRLLKRI